MAEHVIRSEVARRWLTAAIALLLAAGLWAVDSQQASASTFTVEATNFAFTPQELTVQVGDTITWTNGDAESHAVQGGSLASPEILSGQSFSSTFTAPEDIVYFCRFHTYMTGTLHVVAPGQPAPTVPPTTVAPTIAPPTTPPAVEATGDIPTTTVAPARPAVAGRRAAAFQEVPDDPSARRPPGATAGTRAAPADGDDDEAEVDTPAAATTPTPPAANPSHGGPATTPSVTRSSDFQDVPHDPSADHPPGQLVAASTEEVASPDRSPPVAAAAQAAGTPLGDGTVLAPFTRVDGVKEFHLTMAETTIEVSPGVVKQAYAFNGIVPGPVLRVDEGDRVRIVVDNQLPFPTATHWHGMILPNDQDGVGGITQPHIEPGARYVYEWTAVATGTHWYHAHSSGRHIGKGLYGPLEVVPKDDDLVSDRDYRLMLGDTDLGFTINGRSFPSTPTLESEVGETVRLRVINTGDQVHAFHLHGVPFRVMAQDGIRKVQPEGMDTLTISPGQTFDLLFEQVHPGKWLIHCHMFVHSHMSGDAHAPGESGMNGMVAIVDARAASGDRTSSTGLLPDLLPISTVGGSDLEALSLVAIGGLLLVARRKRRQPPPNHEH